MKLAAYIRVSTDGQIDAFGKDVQVDTITRFAQQAGHDIIAFFEDDGVSGKTEGLARPAIIQLLAEVDEGTAEFEGVVAMDPSRYAREFFVQETLYGVLWAKGLKIFCANGGEVFEDDETDPMRKFMRRVFGLLAELERDTVYNRLHSGRRKKIENGGYGGGTPAFGLKVVGRKGQAALVPDPDEQLVIQKIFRLRDEGLSHESIARRLNRDGHTTKRGKAWRQPQITRILRKRLTISD